MKREEVDISLTRVDNIDHMHASIANTGPRRVNREDHGRVRSS